MLKWGNKINGTLFKNGGEALKPAGRGVLGLIFAGYLPLASQNPYPIIVYSVAIL